MKPHVFVVEDVCLAEKGVSFEKKKKKQFCLISFPEEVKNNNFK